MNISKSKFVAGCQCLKRLYFQVHQPGLAAEPDAASEAIIEQGREVGLLARTFCGYPASTAGSALHSDVGIAAVPVSRPPAPTSSLTT
jgi:hypothetical protein